jgi:hypothetical protein
LEAVVHAPTVRSIAGADLAASFAFALILQRPPIAVVLPADVALTDIGGF